MKNTRKRGMLTSIGAFVAAAALALTGSAAANAATVDTMPQASAVVITKYDSAPGAPATGLPQSVTGNTLKDVTFEAYAVPVRGGTPAVDLEPGTNEWQEAVAGMTAADAAALVDFDNADRVGTTDDNGIIVWADEAVAGVNSVLQGDDLERGLYLVRETAAPAGVVPSNDFLIAVPLTHPEDLNAWLDTIYVYPKNRTVEGTKTVENAEDFVVGNTVTWTIDIDNPSPRDSATGDYIPSDKFLILDTIKDEFLTETAVRVTTPAGLTLTDDYTVARVAGTGTDTANGENGIEVGYTQIQINFTTAGLAKLAAAMNDTAVDNVVVEIDTTVNKVGVIENSAQFYSSENQTEPKEVPETSVKYGNVLLNKLSTDDTVEDLSGAEFRVYRTEAAAQAKSDTPYSEANPTGYLMPAVEDPANPAYNGNGLWTTDADGSILIGGFRYSGFADGESFDDSDARYQTYWLAETKALDGHQLLGEPVEFTVGAAGDTADGDLTVLEYDIVNAKDGGFQLPLTGGTGTMFLIVAGVALLSVVLIVGARRRNSAVSAE